MAIAHSSTLDIPATESIPRHVAIIMDGNGRWARKRLLPRIAGHRRGSETVRKLVQQATRLGVEYLTLFAFSSENWRRPPEEVGMLMQLFMTNLENEVQRMHAANIRLRIIGDQTPLGTRLKTLIAEAHQLTRDNSGLTLTVAVNYGGRWDILQAFNTLIQAHPEKLQSGVQEQDLQPYLAMGEAPEPDLFIRTGGEQRISNFLLWQLAYTELYFTDTLWPDFDQKCFLRAVQSYQTRERRFGRTGEQCYVPGS